jgi:hypothetical protein
MKALSGHDWTGTPLVLHFRIATHGTKDAAMTHPFPVCRNDAALVARASRAHVGLAHNGIIAATADMNSGKSDTYHFVVKYAAPQIRGRVDWHKDRRVVEYLDHTANSKLAILSGDGHIETVGWFTDGGDGCRYSNASFREYVVTAYTRTGHPFDDWDKGDAAPRLPFSLADAPKHHAHRPARRRRRRLAAFMPVGAFVQDKATSVRFSADEDAYVYDSACNVYLFDDATNAIVEVASFRPLSASGKVISAPRKQCQWFTLLG